MSKQRPKTWKDFEKLSRQEIFDIIYLGLEKQGWRQSKDALGFCMLRIEEEDGTVLHCAAGHILPEETVLDKAACSSSWLGVCESIHEKDFILHCQVTHDTTRNSDMQYKFHEIALHFNLTIPKQ